MEISVIIFDSITAFKPSAKLNRLSKKSRPIRDISCGEFFNLVSKNQMHDQITTFARLTFLGSLENCLLEGLKNESNRDTNFVFFDNSSKRFGFGKDPSIILLIDSQFHLV